MLKIRSVLLVAAWLAVVPVPVSGQVSTMAEPITEPFLIRRPLADLDALTRLYNTSDWPALQRLARDIICVARRNVSETIQGDDERDYESCPAGPADLARTSGHTASGALDLTRNHVALMWLGHDAFGKPQLLRTVAADTRRQWYNPDLPGVSADGGDGQLSELFLSRSPQGRVSSVYVSKREQDPLLAQVPGFLQALAGPLFSTIGAIAGRIPDPGAEAFVEPLKPKLTATVKRVGLPFRRATIRLQAIAREPVSSASFAGAAGALASSVTFSEVPHAPCARDLAATLAAYLPPVTRAASCSGLAPDAIACVAAFDTVLTRSFTAAINACEAGKPSRETVQALATVDRKFRELVEQGTSTSAQLDLTFRNRPATRFAFGAGGAVMIDAWQTRPRVDANDGVIVASPLTRVMTMAFVNWSPAGYDADDPDVSRAERWRVFFGAALTPDFGPALGINVLLVRGIGVTAGGALLFGNGADVAEIGQPPVRPADPYRLSVARTAFVGISYTYK